MRKGNSEAGLKYRLWLAHELRNRRVSGVV